MFQRKIYIFWEHTNDYVVIITIKKHVFYLLIIFHLNVKLFIISNTCLILVLIQTDLSFNTIPSKGLSDAFNVWISLRFYVHKYDGSYNQAEYTQTSNWCVFLNQILILMKTGCDFQCIYQSRSGGLILIYHWNFYKCKEKLKCQYMINLWIKLWLICIQFNL